MNKNFKKERIPPRAQIPGTRYAGTAPVPGPSLRHHNVTDTRDSHTAATLQGRADEIQVLFNVVEFQVLGA